MQPYGHVYDGSDSMELSRGLWNLQYSFTVALDGLVFSCVCVLNSNAENQL